MTGGDAVLSDDAPTSATIPANQTTVTVTLSTEDDSTDEPNATLTLTLTDGAAYDLGSDSTATLTVQDNDGTPALSAADAEASEDADLTFELTLDPAGSQEVTVNYTITADTAQTADYTGATSGTVTFAPGDTSKDVTLNLVDDSLDEPDETVTLTLSGLTGTASIADGEATGTITDNDLPVVTAASGGNVTEGEDAEFTLTRASQDTGAALTVTFAVTGGGSVLTNAPPTTATIPANQTAVTVSLATTDDNTDEPNATLTLTLTDGDAYDLGSDSTATLTVQDNDGTPALSAADAEASEDADLVFEITLNPASSGTVTVNYAITPDTAQAADYTGSTSATVTFAPGDTSKDVTLDLVDDTADEPDETVTITLSGLTGTASIADSEATGTITDNDLPQVTAASGGNVTEGANAEFTLTRASENTGAALTVTFTVTGGGSVLTNAPPTTATIPANATTVTVSLATTDDSTDEPNATLTLTLTDGDAYDLGSGSTATLTVQDNDGTPALSAADAEASEDADLTFELTLGPAGSQEVTVNYAITPDTAQTADYTGTTSGTVTFAPGDTSKDVTLNLVDDSLDEPDETVTLTLSGLTGTASIADGEATGTITDNDLPVVTAASGGNVTEGADAEFTLTRASQDTSAALTVTFSVTGGDAVLSDDPPISATILANKTTVTVTLSTEDDNTDEPNATLTLTLTDGDAYDLGSDSTATLTVQDNDGTPALTAADASASEDADLVFTLNLSPVSSGTVTVNYAITPDTAQAADYTGATSGTITFAPGDTSKDVTLDLVDDTADEPDETVTLTLSGLTGTARIADGTATGTITDNDLPSVTVSSGGSVTEGEDAEFTLTRASQDTGAALTVTFAVTGGDAVLSNAPPTSATIPANKTAVTVSLATTDDSTDEPNATLTLTLTDGAAYDLGSDSTATLTVQDNDGTPALSAADAEASEDADLTFELTLDPAGSQEVTVNYAITPDTAQAADYTGSTSGSVTFAPGDTSKDVTLDLVDDTADEPDETVTLTLSGLTGTASIADGTATGTITDNDFPVVTAASGSNVTEGADAEFTLTRASEDTGAALTVTFAVTGGGSVLSNAPPTTATIPANKTAVTVSLATTDDSTDEPNATLTLTLTDGDAYDLGSDSTATLTVQDNDGTPALSAADASASEDADLVFEITLNPASSGTVTVNYAITPDTAQAADYTGATSGTVTFAPGETTKDVTLYLVDDSVDEPDETVTLTLSGLTGTASLADGTATGTITDNDLPQVTAASGGSVTEGANAEFTLTRASQDTSAALTVTFSVTGGDAVLSDDPPTSATILANKTTVTVTLSTEDDNTDEPNATLTLTLTDGDAYDLGADSTATLTVQDNDGTPALSAADAEASEDADLVFEITLNPASSGTVTVNYAITPDTAQAADYTGATSGTVTFAPGDTTKDVTLDLVDDTADEPDETVTLTLSGLTGTASIADGEATGTITDNDLPVVTAASGGNVTEGEDAEFTLTRASQATGAALTVTFAVTGGGSVLSNAPPTTATIPANATTVTVSLATTDDETDEPNVTLTLTLTDGDAYDLGSGSTATLTVQDNDDAPDDTDTGTITGNTLPRVTVVSATGTTGGEAVFTLMRTGDLSVALVVRYQSVYRGQGVSRREGYVTFAEGSSTLEVRPHEFVEGIVTEADRTADLTLLPPDDYASDYVVGDPSEATLQVAGTPRPALSAADASVSEDANLVFTLTLSPASTESVTVNYAITPDTAQAEDYTGATSGAVTFAPGDTSKNVTLDVVDDDIAETDETVTLTLTLTDRHEGDPLSPGFYRVGTARIADATATGTIEDNDLPVEPPSDNDLPVVTVASGGNVTEGANAEFTLTRDGATTEALDVTFTVSGGGSVLSNAPPTSATIPADATTVTLSLATSDDETDEPNATLTLTLTDGDDYNLGSDSTATLTVQDNDGTPALTMADAEASEDADLVFELSLSPVSSQAITVDYAITADTAQAADYTGATSGTVTFAPGDTSKDVTLDLVDDTADETDETVTLTLSGITGTASIEDATATGTITDNDLPSVTAASGGNVTEGADAEFTLTRASEDTGAPLIVTFAVTGGGSVLSGDAPASATIPADATTVTVALATEDDETDEPNATLTLTLTDGAAYDLGSDSTATLTVQDNDGTPALSAADAEASEDAGLVFTLNLRPAGSGTVTVNYAITPDTAQAADYTGSTSGSVTFAPGETSKDVTLDLVDDSLDEPDETVTLTLSGITGTASIADGTATGTITDNDLPVVTVSSGGNVTEGADAEFTLTRASQDTGAPLTVTFSVTGGGSVLSGNAPTSATIPANKTMVTVALATEDDETDEPDATLTLTLTDGAAYDLGSGSTATLTVQDNDDTINDDLPVVTVTSGGNVTEGANAEFTLTRAGEDTGEALTVAFTVAGGDAVLSDDPPTSATIPANETTVTVTLATSDDNTDEPNATLTLTLADGDAYDLGTPSSATVTVADNDTPTLSVADASASEDANLVFELTLSPASLQEVTVDYEITPDTAQAADYTGTTSGAVTFAPGETSKNVTLNLVDDEAAELDETVTLKLANLTGPANLGDGTATGTITDNDQQVVTVESATETENGEVVFTLRRRGNLSIALSVGYRVVYQGQGVTLREGYLTFAEGSSTLEMHVPEFVEGIVTESDRTAELTLLPPDDHAPGYVVGEPSEATLRVAGTPRPALSVADAAASESAALVFALTLSPASELSVAVDYAITPDTAQAADYTGATSGTVTFAPGDTSKNVTLDVVDDGIAEPDETLTLTLTLHEGDPLSTGFYRVGTARIADATATGTIEDNDPPGEASDDGSSPEGQSDGEASGDGSNPKGQSDGEASDDGSSPEGQSDGEASDDGSSPEGQASGEASDDGSSPEGQSDGEASDDGSSPEGQADGEASDGGSSPKGPSEGEASDDGSSPEGQSDGEASDGGSSPEGQASGEASDGGSSPEGQASGEASDDGSSPEGQSDGEASDDGSSPKGSADGEASDDGSSPEGQSDGEASDDGSSPKGSADGEASDGDSSPEGQASGEESDDGSSPSGSADGEASGDDAPSPAAPTAAEKPGTVRHLSVSVGIGGLTISWEAPDAGGAASGYDVDYDLAGAAGEWVTALDNGEATSVTVTGLAPGEYRIRVRATNPYGSSKWARDRVTVGG